MEPKYTIAKASLSAKPERPAKEHKMEDVRGVALFL